MCSVLEAGETKKKEERKKKRQEKVRKVNLNVQSPGLEMRALTKAGGLLH